MVKNQVSFRVLIPQGVDTTMYLMELVSCFKPHVVSQAEKLMDKFTKDKIVSGAYNDITAYDYWVDRRMAATAQGFVDVEVDTGFTLNFAPLKESFATEQRVVLGVAYCVQEPWLREWLRQPTVEEYGFWGVTARPSRIRAEDWERRGREWDATMNPNESINTQTLSIEVLGPYEPYPVGMRACDAPVAVSN